MVTITGHKGFLGKALVAQLLNQYKQEMAENKPANKYVFYGFDLPEHTIIWPDPWNPLASRGGLYKGPDDLEDKVEIADGGVIHVAAVADLYESDKNPERNERVNVEGTRNVARLCAKYKRRMTYISTCCAYGSAGEDGRLLTEEVEPKPTELYAESKLAGEKEIA